MYESNELALLKTHYYGGIKKYQWTAIPLSLHGKIVRKDGEEITVCIGEKEGDPQFTITDILPHLGKDQLQKRLGEAFTGEDLNVLAGSLPLTDGEGEQLFKLNIMNILNQQYGIVESDLISAELEFVPAFKAVDIGFDRSMIGAYGHDDRVCAYPALEAVFKCKTPEYTRCYGAGGQGGDWQRGATRAWPRSISTILWRIWPPAEGLEARHVYSKSTCPVRGRNRCLRSHLCLRL